MGVTVVNSEVGGWLELAKVMSDDKCGISGVQHFCPLVPCQS
jgi:hypothetical protein